MEARFRASKVVQRVASAICFLIAVIGPVLFLWSRGPITRPLLLSTFVVTVVCAFAAGFWLVKTFGSSESDQRLD